MKTQPRQALFDLAWNVLGGPNDLDPDRKKPSSFEGSELAEREPSTAQRAPLETSLRRAQRLEKIGESAGGIAHDLGNVLTPVLAHAELALDRIAADHSPRLEET